MKYLLSCILLSIFSLVSYAETVDCAKYRKENYETIRKVNEFTDSAVGFAGTKPEHFVVYECVLEASNSIHILKELVNSRNLPAQLYGLMGLYVTSDKEYAKYKRKFESSSSIVNTTYGCLGSEDKVSEVVKYIESLPRKQK
ncbi:hypothetical protein [Cellvibrio sp. NN19]|uniref:hypothetical protein n=1 Tax=Cellvibrio chitinivorans TaxID=3102792 RepID=UPI002B409619|nr:hypothetical protein [Cellvibrio sp. NN19]